ncbi:MAG: peptidoglycan bridge formation glycyltransferase FemA/FemB family protein [bacterium]|nr:peptidoglycan bridge formation glycyltransferase FemA/FemB family protein [bacterium]
MDNTESNQINQDLRQSTPYAKYMQEIGWRIESVKNVSIFIRPLGILGAIAKIQRAPLPLPWGKIDPILKKHRVWMTKLEPWDVKLANLKSKGFRQDRWPLLATKTQRINLSVSLPGIKSGFKKDARYSLRKSEGLHLSSERNNFPKFYSIWTKANRVKKLWTPPRHQFDSLIKAFGSNCFCITVKESAGALVLVHQKIAYYYYAASLPEAKRLSLPYFVVWNLIKEAKKQGCVTWDWEGIFDLRWPTKSWKGFTHFKKSFGGEEISFPGSFTRWF